MSLSDLILFSIYALGYLICLIWLLTNPVKQGHVTVSILVGSIFGAVVWPIPALLGLIDCDFVIWSRDP